MKKCMTITAVFTAATLTATAAAQPAALTLAERGKPAGCVIVRPAEASPSQVYAAEELRDFVGQLTGVSLTIQTDDLPLPKRAILLGGTKHTQALLGGAPDWKALGDDGFRLATRKGHLLVVGGPVRGTLYGVYEVLERFGGCRWYSTWRSVIPALAKLEVPELDETHTPAIAMREPFWYDMFNGDLAARNRVNGNAMQLAEKHGGKYRYASRPFVHTFQVLLPEKEFFDTHPEYFCEHDGKRVKGQPCLTNPDVLRIVTERVLKLLRDAPGAKLVSVSQNDNAGPCTCAECKAIDDREGSPAGTIITFVNQVAEAIEKEFPDIWVETFAYAYSVTPPKTVRPRHNVMIRYCTMVNDMARPMETSPHTVKHVENLKGWGAITDKISIWDYATDFNYYIAPFPNIRALQPNIRFFKANHCVALFSQGAYQGRHGEFAELKAWLTAKWMWNPELPLDALLDDFLSGYYGAAAAPFIRQYIDKLHDIYTDPACKILGLYDDVKYLNLPPDFLAEAETLWRQAQAAVKDDPALLYNVRMGTFPLLFARLAHTPDNVKIKVWCTENPKRYLDTDASRRAKEILEYYDEANAAADIIGSQEPDQHRAAVNPWRGVTRKMYISEFDRCWGIVKSWWQDIADQPVPEQGTRNAFITHDMLSLDLWWGGNSARNWTVEDPAVPENRVIKLNNAFYNNCIRLRMDTVAFDPGKRYKIRARIRFDKTGADGEALYYGVESLKHGIPHLPTSALTAAQVTGEYAWYDLIEFTPTPLQMFWIGSGRFDKKTPETTNPALNAVYIDKLEIEAAE